MPIVIFFLMLLISHTCSAQTVEGKWYKGNLHTHSYWSDGDAFPEMIMEWYKTNDYQFVALSDHNIFQEGEKWITVPKMEVYQTAFQKYLKKYGEDWVNYKKDDEGFQVQLKTLQEYQPLFEEKGEFLIIPSEEISDEYDGKPIHLNATNVQKLIPPQGGKSVANVMQKNIDAVLAQRSATGTPMFPHINHPNFHYAISLKDMQKLNGERFFEVFNGHPMVNNYGDEEHIGTEKMWDLINKSYLKNDKPLMFGIATDDSHNYHVFGGEYSNSGRGWVMVKAESLDAGSLIVAMEEGSFYASSGVTLQKICYLKNKLSVEVKVEEGVNYEIQFIGIEKGKGGPKILKTEKGQSGTYQLTEETTFVRAKIISDKEMKNPVLEKDKEAAWVQPVVYGGEEFEL
ncbi:PHP domain-containing protein [Flexithrix dorotheae]|uniref:PHP domain-containing protein n=1 Tax=Flexithrix dorotheae TaxID=70993 RepID=UPI0003AAECAF|nr:histidinol-phosphatase [Flexithrix dorotheae]